MIAGFMPSRPMPQPRLVEHDMEIVSRHADRVVAFYQGCIPADGDPRDVLKDPEVGATSQAARDERRDAARIDHLVVEIQSMPALRVFFRCVSPEAW
jgi:ABC-type glutathione transport system ATPase component